jgi:hypothetical protein
VVEAATPPVGPQGRPLVAWPPKTPNGLAPCPRSTARKTSLAQYSLRASERVRLCAIAAAFSRSCSRRDAKALPLRTLTPADTTWCALAREQMRRARRRPRGRAVARDFSQYDGALNLRPRACCARAPDCGAPSVGPAESVRPRPVVPRQVPAVRRAAVHSFEIASQIRGVFVFALECALSRAYWCTEASFGRSARRLWLSSAA